MMKTCRFCVTCIFIPFYFSLLLVIFGLPTHAERTFTDARGEVFRLADDAPKPKIIINAKGALSLFHLGLKNDQVAGIFDPWVVRGSNLNPEDFIDQSFYNSSLALDPHKEELVFLSNSINLSPDCLIPSDRCYLSIEMEELEKLEFDFFIVMRPPPLRTLPIVEKAIGKKVIWMDDKYEHGNGCLDSTFDVANEDNCNAASLIYVVQRLEELASFLGIEETPAVVNERQAMCRSAQNFAMNAEFLHRDNVYIYAGNIDDFGGDDVYIRIFSPKSYPFLRTLEVLGAPIVHPIEEPFQRFTRAEWFANDSPAFPVDFWLLDSETYVGTMLDFDGVLNQFPDPAIKKKQFSYSLLYFNNAAISYVNIRRMLDEVSERMKGTESIHGEMVDCACSDVTGADHTKIAEKGLQGKFACFDAGTVGFSLYTECPLDAKYDEPEISYDECTPTFYNSEGSFHRKSAGLSCWVLSIAVAISLSFI